MEPENAAAPEATAAVVRSAPVGDLRPDLNPTQDRRRKKRKAPAEKDPVLSALKKKSGGMHDVVRLKAHRLNEENQEKVANYIEGLGVELTVFDIQGSLGMAGFRRFSPVICANVDTLTRVSLPANNLTLPAVLDIVCALKLPSNNVLQLLDLSSNPIGSDGFKTLMQKLLLNESVSALLVSRCSIGDAGVVDSKAYFSGKVRPSHGRYYINLSHNNIGSAGHSTITSSLPTWMSLSLSRQKPPVLQPSSPVKPPATCPAALLKEIANEDRLGGHLANPPSAAEEIPSSDDDDDDDDDEEEEAAEGGNVDTSADSVENEDTAAAEEMVVDGGGSDGDNKVEAAPSAAAGGGADEAMEEEEDGEAGDDAGAEGSAAAQPSPTQQPVSRKPGGKVKRVVRKPVKKAASRVAGVVAKKRRVKVVKRVAARK